MSLPLETGTVLAERYRITGVMGSGAMGEIYDAQDLQMERRVAVKLLREEWSSDAMVLARFQREIKVMSKLSGHPNLVQVFDGGQLPENGRLYIVMELMVGRTLVQEIHRYVGKQELMPAVHACQIARDIACGVAYAHEHKVIHRDLKPGNIMLRRVNGQTQAKVLDFGLAILQETEHTGSRITRVRGVVGTVGYIPPEQMMRTEPSPALDIYSLGVLLFEMLTCKLPPAPERAAVELQGLREKLPKDLLALVGECLHRNPGERPTTMRDVAERLERILMELEKRPEQNEPRVLSLQELKRAYLWTKWRKWVLYGLGGVGLMVLGWWGMEKIHASTSMGQVEPGTVTQDEESAKASAGEHETAGNGAELSQAETSENKHETTENEAEQTETMKEESSTGDVEAPHPAEQKADSTPKKQHESAKEKEKRCQEIRDQATDAHKQLNWHSLLKYTKSKECWKSSSERMTLRIRALFSLRQYSQCVREGSSFKNPEIAPTVEFCRTQVQKEP